MYLKINFDNIDYLKLGNERQQKAYTDIIQHKILEILKPYHPIVTGTIPIEIDLPESDIDIICKCKDHNEFKSVVTHHFSKMQGFHLYTRKQNDKKVTIAEFRTENFLIELFAQNIPTKQQNAYLHMITEHAILQEKGNSFQQEIIKLKASGLKTEPAFAKLLGLKGDPYEEILKLQRK
ncbi:DUF4269 domain-containing protein [Maribacter sp. SA7]|uniref:DUF4269 domain-containing protein n=1 Tax=Maribacter zhoushanensis TaxID=3030012 RepID=UPI0023EAB8C0|nr:DUF4269 domain-containing protein [Maribacter zhoushanensis]MDF4202765.1 DUF4269 domain-containing protein [Maribacter zhoushanensis]